MLSGEGEKKEGKGWKKRERKRGHKEGGREKEREREMGRKRILLCFHVPPAF